MAWCYDQQVATANRRTVDEDRPPVVCLHQELVARPLAEAAHGAYLNASTRIRFFQAGNGVLHCWRSARRRSFHLVATPPATPATAPNLQVASAVAIN